MNQENENLYFLRKQEQGMMCYLLGVPPERFAVSWHGRKSGAALYPKRRAEQLAEALGAEVVAYVGATWQDIHDRPRVDAEQ